MVLESLLTARMVEKKPIKVFPLAMLYSSVGVLLALWLFPGNSLAVIAFTVIAAIPLMVNIMREEEKKEEHSHDLIPIKVHKEILPFFVFLFLGLTLSFVLWFTFLPQESVSRLFSSQLHTISQAKDITGNVIFTGYLTQIFFNNLKVMLFALFFSLLYGAGAIFIITWNASLVAVAIANSIRTLLAEHGLSYFSAFSLSLAKYLIHGIPEIVAYFIAGLVGGVLSVSLLKKQVGTPKFTHALLDAFALLSVAIFLLLVGAILEVVVSPFF